MLGTFEPATHTEHTFFSSNVESWEGWTTTQSTTGHRVRYLEPSRAGTLRVRTETTNPLAIVFRLAEPLPDAQCSLGVLIDNAPVVLHQNRQYPEFTAAQLSGTQADAPCTLIIEVRNLHRRTPVGIVEAEILPTPPNARFLPWPGLLGRLLLALSVRDRCNLSSLGFPLCYFDGTKYLKDNPELLDEVLAGRYRNALEHFLLRGKREGKSLPLVIHREASRGAPDEAVRLKIALATASADKLLESHIKENAALVAEVLDLRSRLVAALK